MGVPAQRVDGNDALAVWQVASELVAQVRAGAGPRLLHAITYRVKGHVSVDPAAYRSRDELEAALQTDPINRLRERYKAEAGTKMELDAIDAEAVAEVERALRDADAAPWPDAQQAYTDVQDVGARQWH